MTGSVLPRPSSDAFLPPPPWPSQSISLPAPPLPSCCDGAVPAAGRNLQPAQRPPIRVTSEFDSEAVVFFNKVSCMLLDGMAKLKLSFQNDHRGQVAFPQIGLLTKHFSVLYDVESRNALLKGSFDLANNLLRVCATHDVKEQQGEVSMATSLGDPSYKLELTLPVPSIALEENMTFIPSVILPSNSLSFAFKRRFSPSDKLSYWYQFDSNDWSAVYKHTTHKDLMLKVGYDSGVRVGWVALWVGNEDGKTKTSPMKMKAQFMLQVRQDDIRNLVFMFRLKKRWDF